MYRFQRKFVFTHSKKGVSFLYMEGIKVSLLATSMRGGGAERVLADLANEFSRIGLEVDMVLMRAEGPYLNRLSKEINVVDLKAKHIYYDGLPRFIKYIAHTKPEALLSTINHTNIVAILSKQITNVKTKIVVTEVNHLTSALENAESIKKKVLLPLLIKNLYKKADFVVAVSKGVAEDLVKLANLDPQKVKIIYNPLPNDLWTKAEELVEHPWLSEQKEPVIVSVGRLVKQKDYGTLIRAFAIVRKERKGKLIILGEGKERWELEKLIRSLNLEDDVDMPGFVDNPYKYMRKATVFVLSSIFEGFANVVAEALACGVPVVATDCPSGPREILENGKYGFLVKPRDYEGMAEKIIKIIDGHRFYVPKEAIDKFRIEFVAKEYLKLLL